MSCPLTQNLVLQRSRMSDIRHVRRLNAASTQIDDISVLIDAANLEVCSLSANTVGDLFGLSNSNQIKELHLRKNAIRDIRQVLHLSDKKDLSVLNLSDNPICLTPHYRKYVIAALPSLEKLDEDFVTPNERHEAEQMFPSLHLERPPSPVPQQQQQQASPQRTLHHTASAPDMRPMRNDSFGSAAVSAAPPLNRTMNGQRGEAAAVAQAAPPRPAARASASRMDKRDEAMVSAVTTLFSQMSPEALREVQQYLETLV